MNLLTHYLEELGFIHKKQVFLCFDGLWLIERSILKVLSDSNTIDFIHSDLLVDEFEEHVLNHIFPFCASCLISKSFLQVYNYIKWHNDLLF